MWKSEDGRLGELRRRRPDAEPWLSVLGEALSAVSDPSWSRAVSVAPCAGVDDTAPILRGATLTVDVAVVRRHADRLLSRAMAGAAASCSQRAAVGDADAVALLEAAIAHDSRAVDHAAGRAGLDRETGRAVVPLVALPVLHACRATLGPEVAARWTQPYCPVCGEWPTLAEIRGLDQRRRFRCFRCGGDWHAEWLHCPYCGNREYRQLRALAPRDAPETRRVETCDRCLGYVKSLATLGPCPSTEIALIDLDTTELDTAAAHHGYVRHPAPPPPLDVTIVADGVRRGGARSGGSRDASVPARGSRLGPA